MAGADDRQGDLFPPRHRFPPRLTPQRKIGSPGPPDIETAGRDAALDNLEAHRGSLCETGREIAIELTKLRGRITSVEVFSEMRARGYDEDLNAVDPRWIGVIFREKIWRRRGWEQTGSHRRPVAIWELEDPANIPLSPRDLVYQSIGAREEGGATVNEIQLASSLTPSQVRKQVNDLLKSDLIMTNGSRPRRSSRRPTVVYVLPFFHPEIV